MLNGPPADGHAERDCPSPTGCAWLWASDWMLTSGPLTMPGEPLDGYDSSAKLVDAPTAAYRHRVFVPVQAHAGNVGDVQEAVGDGVGPPQDRVGPVGVLTLAGSCARPATLSQT